MWYMCSVEHIYGLKYLFQYVIRKKSCREADAFITEKGSVSTRAKVWKTRGALVF